MLNLLIEFSSVIPTSIYISPFFATAAWQHPSSHHWFRWGEQEVGDVNPQSTNVAEVRRGTRSLTENWAENASAVLCDRSFLTSSFRNALERADLEMLFNFYCLLIKKKSI